MAGSGKWRACLSVDTHRSPDAEAPSNLHKGISIHSTRGRRFSHRRKIHLSKEISRHNDASWREAVDRQYNMVNIVISSSASAHCLLSSSKRWYISREAWAISISVYRLVHRYGRKQLVPPIPFHIFNFRIGGHRFCIYAANGWVLWRWNCCLLVGWKSSWRGEGNSCA